MFAEKLFLAKSLNGIDVWYDSVSPHVATHIKDTLNLESLVWENQEVQAGPKTTICPWQG